jgi:Lon protease-like protein
MDIPLFPLHTVLCPGIVVPLHIFEERYRALTRHCLDSGTPFGVVLIRDGREVGDQSVMALAGVGAFAEIRRAGRYPDGRYDLLAAGTGRFTIESVDTGTEPYLVAEVTPLEDEVGDEPRAERLAASAVRRFVRYLELMRAREGETAEVLDIRVELDTSEPDDDAEAIAGLEATEARGPGGATLEPEGETANEPLPTPDLKIPDDPTVLSYLLSGIVEVELPRRQALLEAETTVERLENLVRLLDRELMLLSGRLRIFAPDPRLMGGVRRS